MPRKNTREAETEGISEQTRWEGGLGKLPGESGIGEGPKGGAAGKRVSPAGEVGEGAAAQTPQVEILGVPDPRGRNWELLLNLTQTSNKESETKEYTEASRAAVKKSG